MIKEQKGITLVALVITIIVLLILAGVTIAALSGDNGILTNASKSQQENAIGEAKDIVAMAINEATNAYYDVTYLGGSYDSTLGLSETSTQQAVAEAFIEVANEPNGANITVDTDKHAVVIKTTDKAPKTVHAMIDTKGGLGTWTNGEPTTGEPTT